MNKTMKFAWMTLAVSLLTALPSGLLAGTIAFYDFSEGTVGESVAEVTNAGTLGTDYNGTASAGTGATVTYSDDLPNVHLFASQAHYGEVISPNWKSVAFTVSGGNGGQIVIPLMGKKVAEIGAAGDFTIECFVKLDMAQDWKDIFKFYYKSDIEGARGGNNTQAKFVTFNGGVGMQATLDNPLVGKTDPGTWYHMALVYVKGAEGARGVWKTYLNGAQIGTTPQSATILGNSSVSSDLRLGGWGTSYENFSGKIAAVRISDCALTPGDFLKASDYDADKRAELGGALGVWAFAEGTVGEPVDGSGCLFDSTDKLAGAALGTTGSKPQYSDDVPGDILLADATSGQVLAKNAKSVKFFGNGGKTAGSRLTFPDFRSRAAKAGAFTFEYFCKFDEDYTWRNVFALWNTSDDSFKMCSRLEGLNQFTVQYFPDNGKGTEYFQGVKPSLLGHWHHVALEWDATSKNLTTYVDYVKLIEIPNVDFEDSVGDGHFGCSRGGSNGEQFNGKIFGIRLMPRRLAPSEMLVTRKSAFADAYDEHTVFHWTFEDVDAVAGEQIGFTEGHPTDSLPCRGLASYQNSQNASYSTEVSSPNAQYVRQGKTLLAPNRFSAYFYGYSTQYPNTWSGSHIEQADVFDGVDTHPQSFTAEMFIRRDTSAPATGTNGQLIGGFGGSGINTQSVSTDWYLCLSNDAGKNHALYATIYDTEGKSDGFTTSLSLEDGVWHHLAVTYDASTKEFVLYLDKIERVRHVVQKGLRQTTDKGWRYAIGRGFNSSGFNGWMDDVRVSDVVRPVSEFLRKGNEPAGVLLLVR